MCRECYEAAGQVQRMLDWKGGDVQRMDARGSLRRVE